MKLTAKFQSHWNRWPLRRRILAIMLGAALLVELICMAGFGLSSLRMRGMSTRYARELADNVSVPVRAAFYQQNTCLYANIAAAQAAYLDALPEADGAQALLDAASRYGAETFRLSWPEQSVPFILYRGEFLVGAAEDAQSVMENVLNENYGESDMLEYLSQTPSDWMFSQGSGGYFLVWEDLGTDGRIGMLIPASECYDLTVALTDLLAEQTGIATEGIHSATVGALLVSFAVIAALLALFPLAATRLAQVITTPVEREQARYVRELELAETEKQMLAELDRKKTEFLANISHELKTPLTVVSNYAQSSAQGLADIPEAGREARAMRMIVTEVNRMALLVNQLLDVSRIDEGRLVLNKKPLQIDELIKRTLDTYAPVLQQNGNRLIFNRVYDLPEMQADELRIQQVLVNLLSNAAQHTRGGMITVGMAVIPGGVEISVADTGDGIAEEQLAHLFERFNQSKARAGRETSTGLGLYLCKHFVEAHGGAIAVESRAGEGTIVRFTLME